MPYFEEWKTYTKAVVKLSYRDRNGAGVSYVISNVNTKGLPDAGCGAHLESISITSPAIGGGQENSDQIGSSGNIVLIDYKNTIFNMLTQHMATYLASTDTFSEDSLMKNADLLPRVDIEITCYTNTVRYLAYVKNWNFSFSGSTPSIRLNWMTVCPQQTPLLQQTANVQFTKVSECIKAIQASATGKKTKFKYHDNYNVTHTADDDIDAHLSFINDAYWYNPPGAYISNPLIEAYHNLVNSLKTKDGYTLVGQMDGNDDEFVVYIRDARKNKQLNDLSTICPNLIFVHNSPYKPFEKTADGKIVVPIHNMTFDTDFSKIAVQAKLMPNMNGNKVATPQGYTTQNGTPDESIAALNSDYAGIGNDAITINFSCYNVMAFDRNNLNAPINIQVFNEHGELSPISGPAIVRTCNYSLKGGMIEAQISATQAFNSIITTVDTGDGNQVNMTLAEIKIPKSPFASYDENGESYESHASNNKTSSNTLYDGFKQYRDALIAEDKNPVSFKYDNTIKLTMDSTFDEHVEEFFNEFAPTKGTENHSITYDYVEKLILSGNFGLLALLIGVANYGISGEVPQYLDSDVVLLDKDYMYSKPFCSSNTGKQPYEYENGGLGIAHFDTGNLLHIYEDCGFDLDIDKDHFSKLIVRDDSITGWQEGVFKNEKRLFPIFNRRISEVAVRSFNGGLYRDDQWKKWADRLLKYNDTDGNGRIFQKYMFELWMKSFWLNTRNKLSARMKDGGSHKICVQDAIRIARAKSSSGSYLKDKYGNFVYGKDVETQYIAYANDHKRYMRQKAFCRRCGDIIGAVCRQQFGDDIY